MKSICSLTGLIVLLAGCGGGSEFDTASVAAPIAAPVASVTVTNQQPFGCAWVPPHDTKFKAVTFDVRRDDLSTDSQGLAVNSATAVNLMIDRARCAGFDTAVMQTNIAIDTKTGKLKTDHPIPTDFWKYIEHAKRLGMRVFVKPIPVNYLSDDHINIDTPGIPVHQVLESIREFQVDLAKKLQTAGVDGLYVGTLQYGIDGDQYQAQWFTIIHGIRAVYQGKLIYASCWICYNSVWSQVDVVAVTGSLNWFNLGNLAVLESKYKKPMMLDDVHINAMPAAHASVSLWDMVLKGTPITYLPDYDEQQKRFNNFFAIVAQTNQNFHGFTMGEYMPWLQANNLQNPKTDWEHRFKKFDTLSHSLYNNISAQKTLQSHLIKLWN